MAYSDVDKEKDAKRSTNRSIFAKTNERWSDKQKLEAAQAWLVLGNVSQVARLLGIPRITLQVWKATNWWKELIDDLKVQERIELSHTMKVLIDNAHKVVAQRLEKGDPVVLAKTGEIIMKPVSMRDAHKVAVDLSNQRDVVEKLTRPVAVEEGNTDKLQMLAERFAEFATLKIKQEINKKPLPLVDVVDVTIKESHAEVVQDDPVPDAILSSDSGAGAEVGQAEQHCNPEDGR